ncbi:FAD-binding oxidoreductase [Virgibacillus sp. NKC19-16]|nr:FAD-binding oxidoreductase [Virgibacillus sp. NKC19-16]
MKTIIIGSGIVGASAAYHLAKNNTDVIVVDKEHQGNATSAGAGIVCPWISSVQDENWYKIAKGGAHYYPELIDQLKEDGEHDVGCQHTPTENLAVPISVGALGYLLRSPRYMP